MARNAANGLVILVTLAWFGSGTSPALGASASVEQALKFKPVQSDIEYDIPEGQDVQRCTLKAETVGKKTGWVVRGPSQEILRQFIDTNGDNVVDRWSYFRDGIEVYRDLDTNFNGKVDQSRWLHAAGTRWGIDRDENRAIDEWKVLSPEEATAEIVAALREQDARRFANVLLPEAALAQLPVSANQRSELKKILQEAPARFQKFMTDSVRLAADAEWIDFGSTRPGMLPAEDGATNDVPVYENVVVVVENQGKHEQISVGTLVRFGETWRVIDAPHDPSDHSISQQSSGFFFSNPLLTAQAANPAIAQGGTDEATQNLLSKLERFDQQLMQAETPEQQAQANAGRADTLRELIERSNTPEERDPWVRQFADTVSAAVQAGSFPGGVGRLETLAKDLKDADGAEELVPYIEFRRLMAEYVLKMQAPDADFAKIQDDWLAGLEKFVTDHATSPDAADAMLQLATTQEFSGNDDEAKKWYDKVVRDFSSTPAAIKAKGASRRLGSVGKKIDLRGEDIVSRSIVSLDDKRYQGKAVLIHYWASWSDLCRADLAQLRELKAKYGPRGFDIISVSLDSDAGTLREFLSENRLPWAQVYEKGGLESRLANEMGILTLPTMLLINPKGQVVSRNIHVSELEAAIADLLKTPTARSGSNPRR